MWSAIAHGDGVQFLIAPERDGQSGKNIAKPGSFFTRHITAGKSESIMSGIVFATGEHRMMAQHTIRPASPRTDKPLVVAASRDLSSIFTSWHSHAWRQAITFTVIMLVAVTALAGFQLYQRKLTHGIENSASAVLITDNQGTIEYVNRKFCQLTGYAPEEAIGKNPRILKSDATPREVFDNLWKTILSGREWRGELLNRRKNGEVYWSITSISPLFNDDGEITSFIANVEDINDRKNAEATIERLAYYDPLTDLPNRRMMRDRLELALKRSRRQDIGAALLYIDLDRFKHINDTLGHPTGDKLLREMANRFTNILRDDDIVCRMGGDEFAVILHDIHHAEDAVPVAQKLLEAVAEPLMLEESEVVVTGSIGIALFPKDGEDGNILEKHADIALYHAKEEGKNTFRFFAVELNSSLRDRIAMEQGLTPIIWNLNLPKALWWRNRMRWYGC